MASDSNYPTRDQLTRNGFSYTVDDALNGREYAPGDETHPHAVIVGVQCGFEQLLTVVYSYLAVHLDDDEAIELAEDYLREIGWLLTKDDPEIHVYRWSELSA